MRNAAAFFVLAAAAFRPAAADELVLKDGTVVEWSQLKDLGDSYDVQTAAGGRIRIKKADVAKFVPKEAPPPAAPMTGATFTFDKKLKLTTVNLIAAANQKNAVAGSWTCDGKKIVTPAVPHARLAFPSDLPKEYDVLITAKKESGNGSFYLFLPVQDKRLMIYVDGTDGVEGGVSGVAATTFREKVFKDAKPRQIAIHVRKERLVMLCDEKKLVDWKNPDYSTVTIPEKIEVHQAGVVLGVYDTSYTLDRLSVVYPAAP